MRLSPRASSLLCATATLALLSGTSGAQAPSTQLASASVIAPPATLADRLAGMPDGIVRLSFPARDGVCGNGARIADGNRSIVSDGANRFSITGSRTPVSFEPGLGRGAASWCEKGNVGVALTIQEKKVADVRTYVGGFGKADAKRGTDVEVASADEAVEYLLGLTSSLDKAAVDRALLAVMLANGVGLAERFVELALDRSKPVVARERAIWFLAQLEGDDVAPALAGIMRDASAEQWLRDAAQRGILARADASRRS